jgi:hypothetical protein
MIAIDLFALDKEILKWQIRRQQVMTSCLQP